MSLTARFQYKCTTCEKIHTGFPAVHFHAPCYVHDIPVAERELRVRMDEDLCVADGTFDFVRCIIEYQIQDSSETLSWGVWGSLSKNNFEDYVNYCAAGCLHPIGPFFSWLANRLPNTEYPADSEIPCEMCISPGHLRPKLVLQPSMHPMFVEQRDGIPFARALRLVTPFIAWHSAQTAM